MLDTLNKSLVGSENKDVDMGAYVRAAEAIRDASVAWSSLSITVVTTTPGPAGTPRCRALWTHNWLSSDRRKS